MTAPETAAPTRRRGAAPLLFLLLAGPLCLAAAPPAARAAQAPPAEVLAVRAEPPAAPTLAYREGRPPLELGLTLAAVPSPVALEPGDDDVLAPAARPGPASRLPGDVIPTEPDWGGILRDTGYLLGYQALAFGVLYVSPESISRWSPEQKRNYDFSKYWNNVRYPEIDEDEFWINYVAHPYCGAAYFLDARGRGFGPWGSLVYSFVASGIYEFGAEAFAEPASIQDIFVTPLGGALVGMAVEGYWRGLLAKGESRAWWDSLALFLIDPLGRTNRALDGLFGFGQNEGAFRVVPVVGPTARGGTYGGVELSMQW